MSTGMLILNHDFKIVGVDAPATELFGYQDSEFYNQPFTLLIPSFDEKQYISRLHFANEIEVVARGRHKNGEKINLEYYFHLIYHENNISYSVMINELNSISSDSSEIKNQGSEQHSQGQEWLRYLLRSSPVVVYSCLPTGNFKTTFISENISVLTGYSQEDYLLESDFWLTHLHPDDKENLLSEMSDILFETKSHSFEYRFLCANGHYVWILDKLKISHDENGKPTEMLGYWIDITERKKGEEALFSSNALLQQKSNSLAELNTELSQFTHVVSHDLKAPLRAVHSYCEWLSEDLEGKLEEQQQEYICGMQEAVQQAEVLIDDLLELSRVGHHAGQIESISLSPFLKALVSSIVIDGSVSTEIVENLPVVNVSSTVLTQVFQNLITNAITYNTSNQKTIKINGFQEEDNYIIDVTDNGIGIDPKFHKRIFQLFQRLHTKEDIDGTGIGLAIVQKAVSHLNWNIRLKSTLQQGSVFSIIVPIEEASVND